MARPRVHRTRARFASFAPNPGIPSLPARFPSGRCRCSSRHRGGPGNFAAAVGAGPGEVSFLGHPSPHTAGRAGSCGGAEPLAATSQHRPRRGSRGRLPPRPWRPCCRGEPQDRRLGSFFPAGFISPAAEERGVLPERVPPFLSGGLSSAATPCAAPLSPRSVPVAAPGPARRREEVGGGSGRTPRGTPIPWGSQPTPKKGSWQSVGRIPRSTRSPWSSQPTTPKRGACKEGVLP